MSDQTARLGLPYLAAAQGQKHVTHNEALTALDALVQAVVASRSLSEQPADPAEADSYLLPGGASGADWAGRPAGTLSAYRDGAWLHFPPQAGWRVYVQDENRLLLHDGSGWIEAGAAIGALSGLDALGVGTAPDAANPFAAKLNAALFAAREAGEGGSGDLRLTLNKESASDVLSLLFQSGWSGRAEIGLIGDEALSVKLSADGAGWTKALRLQADGQACFPHGVETAALNYGPLGGLRNHLINGDFRFWGRGTSLTGDHAAERWVRRRSGGVSHLYERGDFTLGAHPLPGEPKHFLHWSCSGGSASAEPMIAQPVENVHTLAGRAASLSFWARAAQPTTLRAMLVQVFGAGGSPVNVSTLGDFELGADWTRFEATTLLPGLAGEAVGPGGDDALELRFEIRAPLLEPALDLALVQLEEGPRATPFETRPEALEASLCARYFRTLDVFLPDAPAQLGLLAMRAAPQISGGGAGADFTGSSANGLVGRQDVAGLERLELDAEF